MATVQTTSRTADVTSVRNFLRAFVAIALVMGGVGLGLVIGERETTDAIGQQAVASANGNPTAGVSGAFARPPVNRVHLPDAVAGATVAGVGATLDEAASGLILGARNAAEFAVGPRWVGESDMTLEEFTALSVNTDTFSPEAVRALASYKHLAQPGNFLSNGQVTDGIRLTALAAAITPVDTFSPEAVRALAAGRQLTQPIFLTRGQAVDGIRWTGLASTFAQPETFSPELARAIAQTGAIQLNAGQVAEGLRMSAMAGALAPVDTFSPELIWVDRYPTVDTFSPELIWADRYPTKTQTQTDTDIPEGIR